MKTTAQLSRDHQVILRALEILKATAASWRRNPSATNEDCRALLDFFKAFADVCHHGKEEKVLFPRLMEAGMAMNGGPLSVMLYEHDKGRQLLRNMEEALAGGRADDFALYAKRYVSLLEDHIAKEDNILFAKADAVLTEEDDEAILHLFDEIELEMGEETHERFHHLLDTLAARYLPAMKAS